MKDYVFEVISEPRPGKKLLVLDIDYTLFGESLTSCLSLSVRYRKDVKLWWPVKITYYTGMDKTSLETSSRTLFVREDVHVTSNIELRNCVTQSNIELRNITSDCYLNIVVSLDCY